MELYRAVPLRNPVVLTPTPLVFSAAYASRRPGPAAAAVVVRSREVGEMTSSSLLAFSLERWVAEPFKLPVSHPSVSACWSYRTSSLYVMS
jgi:hypothetical protein